ncbi:MULTISPECIES: DUF2304 domain-containing protein [Actinoalloteichus]|uniref:DUF2304 domain-containing protein n=1 Tax=Actinoalloteichus fjordicus TaxID=1612552 RepID=A0AAC9PPM8_9PSEU|nr:MULTISPECIES: DUF2304 domain-containing protein [Actinoalloteichus]APU12229.1 hypothetical protein UA74_00650 [Actinoalloteichus fjordicus]APU18181.1 hypothetical protein UA75_00650 [Actinoalloteichus sp. GBA129-24]
MIIQILLIGAVLVLMVFFLRNHGTTRTAAGVKIGFVLFILFGVLAVLWPDALTVVADLVGVGRGTDLLLYGLVVAFAFAMVNTYLRFKELELRHARLARAIAVQSAEPPALDHEEKNVPSAS